MRRFFIWSALAALIGLILAGVAYWGYWNFYSRFQPVTITRNQADIQRLLDEASWVSGGGGGQPLYIVTYRDNPSAQRYEREETAKLRAAGVEVRIIVFARPDREGLQQSTPQERATIAELWLTRDWTLYQRWTATPARSWTAAGVPAADGNLARSAVVEASRQFETRLSGLLKDAGVQPNHPLILWRDRQGFLKACACADSRSWAFIRDDLDAPDRVDRPTAAADAETGVYSADGTAPDAALPYPTLPPIPQPGGEAPAATPQGQPGQNPPQARPQTAPTRPAAPRPAPLPRKQDDTTFF